MGEKGRVVGIDHIQGLVDMSIDNVTKDKPDLLKSQRVKLVGMPIFQFQPLHNE